MNERRHDGVNAALVCDLGQEAFVSAALAAFDGALLVTDDPGLLAGFERIGFAQACLDTAPTDTDRVAEALRPHLRAGRALVLDMGWALDPAMGAGAFDAWGALSERLAAEGGRIVSLYDRSMLIEDQLQAAVRAHAQFAAPSGLHPNPFWLPARMQDSGTLEEQLGFLLGRAVPDYAVEAEQGFNRVAARGAVPDWLDGQRHVQPAGYARSRWHILCLGPLRVYTDGYRRVDWKQPGGSPRKTKALFAYLLQSGERGAHADRICELLWPGEASEDTKRSRLHYVVAMLRKTLGAKTAVLRAGEYYRLNAPAGSWIDISSFEQLCRRAVTLQSHGDEAGALKILAAAERLYGGDLFEDLPQDIVDPEHEDWCLPKRVWLREMALKVQRDASVLLRKQGRNRAALEHAQKALALDPVSEVANAEVLRVFHAQGRADAMARQYRQYRAALDAMGASDEGDGVEAVYRDLLGRSSTTGGKEKEKATKEKPKAGI